jgi:serine/threonine protein kinase
MIGQTISQYQITAKLGAGGMGEVYLATDSKLDRQVALKFLPQELAHNTEAGARILREARAAAKLSHPNVVTIYDVSENDGRTYIVMERVPGRTLRELIDTAQLPGDRTLDLFGQILEGLGAAHAQGIVHRDIKPTNIVVSDTWKAKILDFGLARTTDDGNLTQEGAVVGTTNYMSPEQASAQTADARSDLFTAGVILYEMLTGVCPFARGYTPSTLYAICHEPADPLSQHSPDLPPGYQAVIDKALAKDRGDRYQTAADILKDLKRLMSGGDVTPAPSQLSTVAPPRPKVPSLAVLYLQNLGNTDDEHLSHGITEDLIVDLSRLDGIRVAPMRKIMRFKDSDDDIDEIARKLKAELVLDGSIHRSESSIRVSAQLIDAMTEEIIWSNRWTEPLERVPHIKSALADGIAIALSLSSSSVAEKGVGVPETVNPQAYELYLRAKFLFEHKKSAADVEAALGLYRKALSLDPDSLAAHAGVINILLYQSELDQAATELNAVEKRIESVKDEFGLAELKILRGDLHFRRAEYPASEQHLQEAITLAQKLESPNTELRAVELLVEVAQNRAQLDKGLSLAERMMELADKLQDQTAMAASLLARSIMYFRRGNTDRALADAESALQLARRSGNLEQEAHALKSAGSCLQARGRSEEASPYSERAYDLYEQLGDRRRAAVVLQNMAIRVASSGRYRDALTMAKRCVTLFQDVAYDAGLAFALHSVSAYLWKLGEYEESARAAQEGLDIAKRVDLPVMTSYCNYLIGLNSQDRKNYEDAENHYSECIAIAREAGLSKEICDGFVGMATLHYRKREFDKCEHWTKTLLQHADKSGHKLYQSTGAAMTAALDIRNGRVESGVAALRELCRTFETSDESEADPHILLGECLIEHGLSEQDRTEGHDILQAELAKARSTESIPDVEWIEEILSRNQQSA